MMLLTIEKTESYEKQKIFHICENKFRTNRKYCKIRDHCHYKGKFRGATNNNCNLRYRIPKEIPIVFHNDSTYDYYFIIKQLAINFKVKFDCLGENTEKYITFSSPSYKKMIIMKQSYTN